MHYFANLIFDLMVFITGKIILMLRVMFPKRVAEYPTHQKLPFSRSSGRREKPHILWVFILDILLPIFHKLSGRKAGGRGSGKRLQKTVLPEQP
jgi:hypothetical protein